MPAMGQGSLGEAGIHETDATFLISHILCCRLEDAPVDVKNQCTLSAVFLNQLVNRTHIAHLMSRENGSTSEICRCEIYRGEVLGKGI